MSIKEVDKRKQRLVDAFRSHLTYDQKSYCGFKDPFSEEAAKKTEQDCFELADIAIKQFNQRD